MKQKAKPHIKPARQVARDLLLAGSWEAKCALGATPEAQDPAVRIILLDIASDALERGARDDAALIAAHVTLLDDIEARGRGLVEADIVCAAAMAGAHC